MTTETLEAPATTTDSGTQDTADAATDTTVLTEQDGAPATASADTPQAADTKADGGDTDSKDSPDYEPFRLPEGLVADEELMGEFKAIAKELKLSQDDAQKFADLQARVYGKQVETISQTRAQWLEQTKTDKEFGGEALGENLAVAKKAIDAFAPELRVLLNETGLGNHPDVIRTFVRVGKAISQDGQVITGDGANGRRSQEKTLFPNMN